MFDLVFRPFDESLKIAPFLDWWKLTFNSTESVLVDTDLFDPKFEKTLFFDDRGFILHKFDATYDGCWFSEVKPVLVQDVAERILEDCEYRCVFLTKFPKRVAVPNFSAVSYGIIVDSQEEANRLIPEFFKTKCDNHFIRFPKGVFVEMKDIPGINRVGLDLSSLVFIIESDEMVQQAKNAGVRVWRIPTSD